MDTRSRHNLLVVPEQSTAWLTIEFLDRNGEAESPSSITYRIDTIGGDSVRESTPVSASATIEITLTPDDNQIVGTSDVQTNVVTVVAEFGADDSRSEEYKYQVKNLKYVTAPE